MKKNFYLQHSLMAMNDPRMQHMVDEENLQASGAYWFIIEKLALLPEPRAQLVYLEPHCICHNISYEYIKKIILNYQLFCLEEDGYFTPVELNPVTKRTRKAEEKPVEKNDFEQITDEIEQKRNQKQRINARKEQKNARKEQRIRREKKNNTLSYSDLPKNESDNTKEYIKDIITTAATTEEKEGTAAAAAIPESSETVAATASLLPEPATGGGQQPATGGGQQPVTGGGQQPPVPPCPTVTPCDDFGYRQRPLHPVRPWRELADGLLNENGTWMEIACMKSGYSKLLLQHFKQAVEIFKQHIEAYGKGDNMLDMSEIKRYFVNYISDGSRTSKALHDALAALDAKERAACPEADDPYRFEQLINGQRTYQGCPIPADAPPRPDETAFWDGERHVWVTGEKPKNSCDKTTHVSAGNDARHRPKPRTSSAARCVIGGAEVCHFGR